MLDRVDTSARLRIHWRGLYPSFFQPHPMGRLYKE
jgi:hypothetical protein